jgi:hypothetical protein
MRSPLQRTTTAQMLVTPRAHCRMADRCSGVARSCRSGTLSRVDREIVKTDKAPSSMLFSQGVKVGTTVSVAGMAGIDVATGQLAGPTIEEQTRQSLRNCASVIEAAGGTLDDAVPVTVLLADPATSLG